MDITSLTGVVGQQSLLVIENTPEDVQEYSWHRGANDTEENLIISYNATSHSQQKGPMYSGQESMISTGALLIKESRLNDTGNYTVRAAAISDTQRATGWLEVQEFETLDISVNASIVLEDVDSMAAICHTNNTEVQWYVAHTLVSSSERTAISPDTKTLIITRVKNYDSPLQCGVKIVLGTVIQRSELIYLTMAYGPSYVMILSEASNDNSILPAEIGSQVEMVCVFNGAPESKYRWIHSGSLLSFPEKNITLPSLTWDQMGRHRCIVENNLTQLTLYEEVQVQRPRFSQSVTMSTFLLDFLMAWSILGYVLLFTLILLGLIRCYSTRPGGQDLMGKEVRGFTVAARQQQVVTEALYD
ncbi:carcinoembryonic antigen-related cell adhesion molecule 18-like [Cervus elaphus]|uniref:carcinoembryonic antigen-related cell adhesion molecule 18-like n=1 Tax=Cervus elaphus TaxID=9860 RepID=UPI001CC30D9E|nr:carcinoembryonic antigen-related cell adhesion molecule 18-like [Cervus elaphus]